MKKHPMKHIYTKQQNQTNQQKRNFILKMHYTLEQKKVDK